MFLSLAFFVFDYLNYNLHNFNGSERNIYKIKHYLWGVDRHMVRRAKHSSAEANNEGILVGRESPGIRSYIPCNHYLAFDTDELSDLDFLCELLECLTDSTGLESIYIFTWIT